MEMHQIARWSSLRIGSSANDFTPLGHRKCFGTILNTEIELEISVFYLVPKRCPNWVKSIANDPAPSDSVGSKSPARYDIEIPRVPGF